MGKEKTEREKERKRENASRIYINSLLLRASHISDILARRVVSSQNFKETFSTMIRTELSRASDKLLLVTNDVCCGIMRINNGCKKIHLLQTCLSYKIWHFAFFYHILRPTNTHSILILFYTRRLLLTRCPESRNKHLQL